MLHIKADGTVPATFLLNAKTGLENLDSPEQELRRDAYATALGLADLFAFAAAAIFAIAAVIVVLGFAALNLWR